jgi:hypothetical protein
LDETSPLPEDPLPEELTVLDVLGTELSVLDVLGAALVAAGFASPVPWTAFCTAPIFWLILLVWVMRDISILLKREGRKGGSCRSFG